VRQETNVASGINYCRALIHPPVRRFVCPRDQETETPFEMSVPFYYDLLKSLAIEKGKEISRRYAAVKKNCWSGRLEKEAIVAKCGTNSSYVKCERSPFRK